MGLRFRSIEDDVVVITGASSGIGRATALAFVRAGARVVLAARREDALAEVVAECQRAGGQAVAVPTDVGDAGAVQALAQRAVEHFGRIDVWVNNAGVYMMGPLEEVPVENHRRVIETNLLGTIHGAHAALAQFRRQGHGVLINVASAAGKAGYRWASSYCASKFGIRGLTQALRQEVFGDDIHVCAVFPPSVDTPLFQHAANFTGLNMRAMSPVYSVERLARAIVACARRPRRELEVGLVPRVFAAFEAVVPWVWERIQRRMVRLGHFTKAPAGPTDGNLFQPLEPRGASGGWKRRRALPAAAASAFTVSVQAVRGARALLVGGA